MAFWEGKPPRERWIKHYASFHRILLVGEGDFSFALCLALAFGSASNIVATSFDSYDDVISKYRRGKSNLRDLERLGARLVFKVDATKMKRSSRRGIANGRFDRIVYNFPHAGFHGKEHHARLIRKHKKLVDGFFHNAAEMLQPSGEVHVTHKTSAPYRHWKIVKLALRNSLKLLECVNFDISDYRGYENKRGDGSKPDDPFTLGECCTYKFGLTLAVNKISTDTDTDVLQLNYSYVQPRSVVSNPGWIRLNLCGLSMGEPGLAGCGGVLVDDDKGFCFRFSAFLGNLTSEAAELCAMEVGLCEFMRSGFCGLRRVLIRSNSDLAVYWVKNPGIRPVHLIKHFIEIDYMLERAYAVCVEFIRREENLTAELLAKDAIVGGL